MISDDGKRMEVYFLRAGRCVSHIFPRGGVQGRGVVRDFFLAPEISAMAAVQKFAKHFGKLMVFQDEGDVGGAFALLLLCFCFGVTPIGAL